MNFTVTVLGSGTSTGVPIPGCRCKVCLSNNPRNRRFRTSIAIRLENSRVILVDASIDLRMQSLTFGIERVDAVLFTHAHADHILGTDDLRCFNFVHRNVIPCYATTETLSKVKQTFPYIFEANPNYEGGLLAQLRLHEFKMYQPFEVEGVKIEPFRLAHGSMEVAGFKIGDFAYATDCKTIPEQSREMLRGVKWLILDGLRYEAHKTHLTIEEALEMIADLKPGHTYLTHMTHAIDHDQVNSKLPEGVELAYDGLKIEGSINA